VILDIGRITTA